MALLNSGSGIADALCPRDSIYTCYLKRVAQVPSQHNEKIRRKASLTIHDHERKDTPFSGKNDEAFHHVVNHVIPAQPIAGELMILLWCSLNLMYSV